jgi:voltage-gated potassium channel
MLEPGRRCIIASICIIIIFFTGIFGYHLIEGWSYLDCMYMMVITLSTIGFGETHPLSPAGRLLTIFIIVFGISTGAYVLQGIARFIIEGELSNMIKKQKLQKQIEAIKDHFIICGFGRIGSRIASELKESGVAFVIVERDSKLNEHIIEEKGYLLVEGDATDDEILKKSGIERAKGLVSALASDADNVYVVLSSRELNGKLIIISRCREESGKKKLYIAGADKVISPYHIGALRMSMAVIKPNVYGFLELITENKELDLDMAEISISDGSALHRVALKDSHIRDKLGVIVIGIKKHHGHMLFNPSPREFIEERDHLIVLGSKAQIKALHDMVSKTTREGLLSITKKLDLKEVRYYMSSEQ